MLKTHVLIKYSMIIYAYVIAPSYTFRMPNPSPHLLFRYTIKGPYCTFITLVYLWEP